MASRSMPKWRWPVATAGHFDVNDGGESGMGGGLDVHRRVPWLVDDATIHALNDQQAKLLFNQFQNTIFFVITLKIF